jgi:membrane-associated phospholipid phosphatase
LTLSWRSKPAISGLVFALMIAALFALRAAIQHHSAIVDGDRAAVALLRSARTPALDQLMMGLSAFGDGTQRIAITLLVVLYLCWRRLWRWAVSLAAAMACSAVLVPLFKLLFQVARPSTIYSGAESYSFPSGHVASATVLYTLLAWIAARGLKSEYRAVPWLVAVLLIALMGLSRIYVGAHWPSDVFGGLALGAAISVPAVLLLSGAKPSEAPAPEPRHDLAVLACLVVVALVLEPHAYSKAQRLYGPYLARNVRPAPSGPAAQSPVQLNLVSSDEPAITGRFAHRQAPRATHR